MTRPGRRGSRAAARCRTSPSPGDRPPSAGRRGRRRRGPGRCGRRPARRSSPRPRAGRCASVASAMAAAVFRPIGSSRITRADGNWSLHEALVAPIRDDGDVVRYGQPGRGGLQQRLGPSSGRNGFGRSGRLRGWSRVPPPPAMMTAYMPPILRAGRRSVIDHHVQAFPDDLALPLVIARVDLVEGGQRQVLVRVRIGGRAERARSRRTPGSSAWWDRPGRPTRGSPRTTQAWVPAFTVTPTGWRVRFSDSTIDFSAAVFDTYARA